HRAARHDRDPAGHQGGRRHPGRDRGDVMATIGTLPSVSSIATLASSPASSWPGLSSQVGSTRLATRNSAELGQARVPMPSTPLFAAAQDVDARNKSGHDGGEIGALASDGKKAAAEAKARANAVDFESAFLSSMFSQMYTGIDGDGPFGGGGAGGVGRSFLTEEYAKTFAKYGGIGIADHVYRSLTQPQELRASYGDSVRV